MVSKEFSAAVGMGLLGLVLTAWGIWATKAAWSGDISGVVFFGVVPIPLHVFGPIAVLGGGLLLLGLLVGLVELAFPRRLVFHILRGVIFLLRPVVSLIKFLLRPLVSLIKLLSPRSLMFRFQRTFRGAIDPGKIAALASKQDTENLWRIAKKSGGGGPAWDALIEIGCPTKQLMGSVMQKPDRRLLCGRTTHEMARSMIRIVDTVAKQELESLREEIAVLASKQDVENLWRIAKKSGGGGPAWDALIEIGYPTRQLMSSVLQKPDRRLPFEGSTHMKAQSLIRIIDRIAKRESERQSKKGTKPISGTDAHTELVE